MSKEEKDSPDEIKPEEENNEASSGSWTWTSWGQDVFKNLTEKSSATLELVKKDLSEFYSTIQNDTVAVVADTARKVQQELAEESDEEGGDQSTMKSVKQGFSSVLTKFSDSMKHLAEAGAQSSFMVDVRRDSDVAMTEYDRKEAITYSIQTNPGTFCNEPDGPPDVFESWLETFDIETYRGEISDLLVKNTDMRAMYIKLVPLVVLHLTFWQRYYYKLFQMEQEESRRAALVARASEQEHAKDEYSWEDDDDDLPEHNEIIKVRKGSSSAGKEKVVIPGSNIEVNPDTNSSTSASTSAENKTEWNLENTMKNLPHNVENLDHVSTNSSYAISTASTSNEMNVGSENIDTKETKDYDVTQIKKVDGICKDAQGTEAKGSKANGTMLDSESCDSAKDEASTQNNRTTDLTLMLEKGGKVEAVDNIDSVHTDTETSTKSRNDSVDGKLEQKGDKKESSLKLGDNAEDDDDFDLDLDGDEDINEEELADIISKIKSDTVEDGADDDDDWESWQ